MGLNYTLSAGTRQAMQLASLTPPGTTAAEGVGDVLGDVADVFTELKTKRDEEKAEREGLENTWNETMDSAPARLTFDQTHYWDTWQGIENSKKGTYLEATTPQEQTKALRAQQARIASLQGIEESLDLLKDGASTSTTGWTNEELDVVTHFINGEGVELTLDEEHNEVQLQYNGKTYSISDINKLVERGTKATVIKDGIQDLYSKQRTAGEKSGVTEANFRGDEIRRTISDLVTSTNQRQILGDPGIIGDESLADMLIKSPYMGEELTLSNPDMQALEKTYGDGDGAMSGEELKVMLSSDDRESIIDLLSQPEHIGVLKTLAGEVGHDIALKNFKDGINAQPAETSKGTDKGSDYDPDQYLGTTRYIDESGQTQETKITPRVLQTSANQFNQAEKAGNLAFTGHDGVKYMYDGIRWKMQEVKKKSVRSEDGSSWETIGELQEPKTVGRDVVLDNLGLLGEMGRFGIPTNAPKSRRVASYEQNVNAAVDSLVDTDAEWFKEYAPHIPKGTKLSETYSKYSNLTKEEYGKLSLKERKSIRAQIEALTEGIDWNTPSALLLSYREGANKLFRRFDEWEYEFFNDEIIYGL